MKLVLIYAALTFPSAGRTRSISEGQTVTINEDGGFNLDFFGLLPHNDQFCPSQAASDLHLQSHFLKSFQKGRICTIKKWYGSCSLSRRSP
jgi:hypothetical protein